MPCVISAKDKIEFFEYKGYKCLIRKAWNVFCGYVGLPKGHKFYKVSYDDLNNTIDVHGDLTFSDFFVDIEGKETDGLWYLGFDTAHSGDFEENYNEDEGKTKNEVSLTYELAAEVLANEGPSMKRTPNKNKDFVTIELTKMVDQIQQLIGQEEEEVV